MRLFEDYGMKANFFTFSWDRKWILSMSGDQKMIVWSVETGEIASGPLIGHIQDVIAVAFSYDGRWIASGSHDKTIRVWKTHLPAQYVSLAPLSCQCIHLLTDFFCYGYPVGFTIYCQLKMARRMGNGLSESTALLGPTIYTRWAAASRYGMHQWRYNKYAPQSRLVCIWGEMDIV